MCTYNSASGKNYSRIILSFSTNFIVVVTLLFFGKGDLSILAFAFTLSSAVCAFLPMVEMKCNTYHHNWKIYHNDDEFKKFWLLFFPIMVGALLFDLQQFVDRSICSSIVCGISYLNYATKLVNVFDSILVVGFSVILLPELSDLASLDDRSVYSKRLTQITRILLIVFVPCATIIFLLAPNITYIFYYRGKFDINSLSYVSNLLKCYSFVLLGMPIISIFSKFFHAKELNKIPLKISTLAILLNIFMSFVLKEHGDYEGAANRTYYAVFHGMRSILALEEKDFSKHSAVISYFRREYIKTGIFPVEASVTIGDAFDIRSDSDYDDEYSIDEEGIKSLVSRVETLLIMFKAYLDQKW